MVLLDQAADLVTVNDGRHDQPGDGASRGDRPLRDWLIRRTPRRVVPRWALR
jgi:hypothetical protein